MFPSGCKAKEEKRGRAEPFRGQRGLLPRPKQLAHQYKLADVVRRSAANAVYCHAPSSLRTNTSWPMWYAL